MSTSVSFSTGQDLPLLFKNSCTLSWNDISYQVKIDGNPKNILNGVSGYAKPGQLLAIIGSTGCGKSTLLDILAGRNKVGKITGTVNINGEPSKKIFKQIGAYVAQDDVLMGTLTVRETLKFCSRLKLHTTAEEQDRKIEEVIDKFGLTKVADTRIGTSMVRGVSGGEKKRTAIASEYITDPGLILLDEPTSGLDSFTAYNIVEELKKLAHEDGKTVVTTIHQPSGKIFQLFDQLMILSHGSLVYFGSADSAVTYFSEVLNKNCGRYENPADFFLEALDELENASTNYSLLEFKPHQSSNNSDDTIPLNDEEDNTKRVSKSSKRKSGFFTQLIYLLWRNLLNLSRDPRASYAQLGQSIFLALLIGSIYHPMGNDQTSIQNRMGSIFFIVTNQAFGGFAMLSLFLEERELFKRERAGGLYTSLPYFLAKFLTEIPVLILFPLVFSSITYWFIGLRPDVEHFFIFVLAIISMVFTTSSLFVLVGSVTPNQPLAQIFAPITLVLFMLFSGFFLNSGDIPNYYIWLKYLSFFKYTYEILMVNELKGLTLTCDQRLGCVDGDMQLVYLHMDDVDIWVNIGILLAMAILYRVLGFLWILFFHVEKK